MAKLFHTNDGDFCPKCEETLKTADPLCRSFFHYLIANGFRDCHISTAWRGEVEQNKLCAAGQSEKPWPESKHNRMVNGKPASAALDLFKLVGLGVAKFPMPYYFRMFQTLKSRPEFDIRWGGDFREIWKGEDFAALEAKYAAIKPKPFRDGPHFELKGVK